MEGVPASTGFAVKCHQTLVVIVSRSGRVVGPMSVCPHNNI